MKVTFPYFTSCMFHLICNRIMQINYDDFFSTTRGRSFRTWWPTPVTWCRLLPCAPMVCMAEWVTSWQWTFPWMILVRPIAPAALASVDNKFKKTHIPLQMLDKSQMLHTVDWSFANQLPCPENYVPFKTWMDRILEWFTAFSQKQTLHKYTFM